VQEERTSRTEAELDRLILAQHVTELSLAGVTMLHNSPPDDHTTANCKRLPAKKSKKKRRSESEYADYLLR